jgi:DNA-binding CsgD family transcriptional regulator
MARGSGWRMVGWGAAAAVALACLGLLWTVPIWFDAGRELAAAVAALLAVAIGFHLRDRRAPPPDPAPPPTVGPEAVPDAVPATVEGAGLSPREREILALLAEGLSNKELARSLSVSENTVKTHLANLYAKLGVGRRTQALAVAQRLGVLKPAGDHPEITRPGDGPA